ncbi:MAG: NAD(P)-dependent oxidoreductase, partial [Flavobacteriales bacterium]|nr:NAD(P)-dependent oxidoreductase [Flavobacteriales bacterium]
MKVMVTGGTGFLGSKIISNLIGKNIQCINYDLNLLNTSNEKLNQVSGDILDKDTLLKSLIDVDIVIHNVAAVPLTKNNKLFNDVNIVGTQNIIECSNKSNVKKLINISSSAIYGIPPFNPVNELTVTKPVDNYGAAKLEAENLLFKNKNNFEFVSIRPRTILGPERLGIFQILFEWIYQNQNIPVLNGGENIYQFVHAKDLV